MHNDDSVPAGSHFTGSIWVSNDDLSIKHYYLSIYDLNGLTAQLGKLSALCAVGSINTKDKHLSDVLFCVMYKSMY